jgi:uncharacterized protein YcbX
VKQLYRYPVKSMHGEAMAEYFVGFPGVYGDRLYAFELAGGTEGFPWLTARQQPSMLRFKPRFRNPSKAIAPLNFAAAQGLGSGLTPLYGSDTDLSVVVEGPDGTTYEIADPALNALLLEGTGAAAMRLLRSERALTDCRPVSLISVQSIDQLSVEYGSHLDPRRFRPNIYADLDEPGGYAEANWIGRHIMIGDKVVLHVLQKDMRCKLITLDPDTGECTPSILRPVAQNHANAAGVYAAVLVEGIVRTGDPINMLD